MPMVGGVNLNLKGVYTSVFVSWLAVALMALLVLSFTKFRRVFLALISNSPPLGILTKQGHVVKNWKVRFFQVEGSEIVYYTDRSV
jgi:hypothetical protein